MHPVPRQKSFGETFGAATGVSDPRLQKITIRNHHEGGSAATVAGDVGPGFYIWPRGHTPQDTYANALIRIQSIAQKDVRRRDRGEAHHAVCHHLTNWRTPSST